MSFAILVEVYHKFRILWEDSDEVENQVGSICSLAKLLGNSIYPFFSSVHFISNALLIAL